MINITYNPASLINEIALDPFTPQEQQNNEIYTAITKAYISAIGEAIFLEKIFDETKENKKTIECFINNVLFISGLSPREFIPDGYASYSLPIGVPCIICLLEYISRFLSGESTDNILSQDSTTELLFAFKKESELHNIEPKIFTKKITEILKYTTIPFIKNACAIALSEDPDDIEINLNSNVYRNAAYICNHKITKDVLARLSQGWLDYIPNKNSNKKFETLFAYEINQLIQTGNILNGEIFPEKKQLTKIHNDIKQIITKFMQELLDTLEITINTKIKNIMDSTIELASYELTGLFIHNLLKETKAWLINFFIEKLMNNLIALFHKKELKLQTLLDAAANKIEFYEITKMPDGLENSAHTNATDYAKKLLTSMKNSITKILTLNKNYKMQSIKELSSKTRNILESTKEITPQKFLGIPLKESKATRKALYKTILHTTEIINSKKFM